MRIPTRALLAVAMIAAFVAGAGCLDGSPEASGDEKAKASKNADAGEGRIVGRVGDRTFTLEEVDRAAMKANIGIFQQVYDARRAALQTLIDEELVARAAAAKGVTPEQLLEAEVASKVPTVTDADVQAFYDQNQARMGGRTFDQVSGQIRDYLGAMNADRVRNEYLATLAGTTGVEIRIDPPRVEMLVADNDPAKGPATAPVTIVEYSDFQ